LGSSPLSIRRQTIFDLKTIKFIQNIRKSPATFFVVGSCLSDSLVDTDGSISKRAERHLPEVKGKRFDAMSML
jgi:hypothetical protein